MGRMALQLGVLHRIIGGAGEKLSPPGKCVFPSLWRVSHVALQLCALSGGIWADAEGIG